MKQFSFSITSELNNSKARVGTISTPHGDIKTPAFITVGTAATVKALTPEQVASVGAQAVLANTYHLYLRPGEAVVKKLVDCTNLCIGRGQCLPILADFKFFR